MVAESNVFGVLEVQWRWQSPYRRAGQKSASGRIDTRVLGLHVVTLTRQTLARPTLVTRGADVAVSRVAADECVKPVVSLCCRERRARLE
jgi:hypothetical protein